MVACRGMSCFRRVSLGRGGATEPAVGAVGAWLGGARFPRILLCTLCDQEEVATLHLLG